MNIFISLYSFWWSRENLKQDHTKYSSLHFYEDHLHLRSSSSLKNIRMSKNTVLFDNVFHVYYHQHQYINSFISRFKREKKNTVSAKQMSTEAFVKKYNDHVSHTTNINRTKRNRIYITTKYGFSCKILWKRQWTTWNLLSSLMGGA